jgi:TonB family protein
MRYYILIILGLSTIVSVKLKAQHDQNNLVDKTNLTDNLTVDQLNFSNEYNIDFKRCAFRELQVGIELSLSPKYSPSSNIHIPQGAIIETYTYYKNKDLYIIYYNKTWGFLPVKAFELNQAVDTGQSTEILFKPPVLLTKNLEKHLKYIFPNNTNGELLLDIQISNTGAVQNITVLKSIPEIDESSIDTLKKLRFKPARQNGSPIEAQIKLPLKYSWQ